MLLLSMQPEEALCQGYLQLLDGLIGTEATLPPGFLDDLISRMEATDLRHLVNELSKTILCPAWSCTYAISSWPSVMSYMY